MRCGLQTNAAYGKRQDTPIYAATFSDDRSSTLPHHQPCPAVAETSRRHASTSAMRLRDFHRQASPADQARLQPAPDPGDIGTQLQYGAGRYVFSPAGIGIGAMNSTPSTL